MQKVDESGDTFCNLIEGYTELICSHSNPVTIKEHLETILRPFALQVVQILQNEEVNT